MAQSHLLNQLARLHSPLTLQQTRIHHSLAGDPSFYTQLDRVDELLGHTGCVNALSWSADGQLLLSGGDDRTVRIWRLDQSSDSPSSFPYTTRASVRTGHSSNIFNTQFLSRGSSMFATCARDSQVRVFDTNRISNGDPGLKKTSYRGLWDDSMSNFACIKVLRCHNDAVKRITTEESDAHFLTVAEDGQVRQHDLRVAHQCDRRGKDCPPPLVKLDYPLLTLAMSPLTPYYFVVAGESPFAHLYDRRNCGRNLFHEWGVDHRKGHLTTCVRSFGRNRRDSSDSGGDAHVTGAKMSQYEPHELLLNYSGDAVYLYNTQDEAGEDAQAGGDWRDDSSSLSTESGGSEREGLWGHAEIRRMHGDDPETGVSCLKPRMRFAGACNVETVKDVNFLGHRDEYVTCGSDDGNFFVWDKATGKILNVLEGDGSVVNVVEQNPLLQCIAVSGIDTSVKIFGRVRGGEQVQPGQILGSDTG